MTQERNPVWSDLVIGLVTFSAFLIVIFGVLFAGGDKGLLFQQTATVSAYLVDVGGLKKGGAVTMGGMTIGKVNSIGFSAYQSGNPIEVKMEIRSDCLPRIKTDAVPSVRTQGMLGDRYIDISLGSPDAPPLPLGQPLIGKGSTDFDETLNRTSAVLEETEQILTAINEKEGSVGQLFYDSTFYNEMTELVIKLRDLIEDFKAHPKKYVKFSLF